MSPGISIPIAVRRAAGLAVTVARGAAIACLDATLPQRCAACGGLTNADAVLCRDCEHGIPEVPGPLCLECLALDQDPSACLRHGGRRLAWAAWVYEERAAACVHAFKFEGRERLALHLAAAIARAPPAGYRPDAVLEVPLHPTRRRERGFDQAARLARGVARGVGAPHHEGALVRRRATREQSGLGAAARRRNLAAAFAVRDPAAWRGREVLVVDDVLTTGSTLKAALEPLEAAGARVRAAVLAWAS